MTRQFDIKWNVIAKIENQYSTPSVRFAVGSQRPILTWLFPSRNPYWTIYIAEFDPIKINFGSPQKLIFHYIRSSDMSVHIPGIAPVMQLVYTQDGLRLIGMRMIQLNMGAFFSVRIVQRQLDEPAEIMEFYDANYLVKPSSGIWEGIHDIFETPSLGSGDMRSATQGVYDLYAISKKSEITLIGSTWDAKIWYSQSPDGGKSWNKPAFIAENGIHPAIVEYEDGHLMAFYTKEDAQRSISIDEGKVTLSTTVGPLWFVKREPSGQWSKPEELLNRMDVHHCSACSNADGHIYLAYDVYPQGPPSVVRCEHAISSDWPRSEVYLMASFDGGKTWTGPALLNVGDAYCFRPDIKLYENNLIISAILGKGEGWSIVGAVLPSPKELLDSL